MIALQPKAQEASEQPQAQPTDLPSLTASHESYLSSIRNKLFLRHKHAAIRLAQGAGRLIRSTSDKGVVAVLDSRLSTERYGGFLRAALPPFWPTTDSSIAMAALKRLAKDSAKA